MYHDARLARRNMIYGLAAGSTLLLLGCGRSPRNHPERADTSSRSGLLSKPQSAAMTVYRDPGCGCCEEWAERAREAGYQVKVTNNSDMAAIKRQHGVPEELASCHTTLVRGYILEGHVPLDDVNRLLKERPAGIKGIAVAGMPRGSPGMEMPDGSRDPFHVMAFDASGKTSVFRG